MKKKFSGIHPDDLHGRMGLRNPERGLRNEIYFSEIPGEIAGTCSCHSKQNKLDGRRMEPVFQNIDIAEVPHLIRGNRLDAAEFCHSQWQDEVDFFAYDGLTVMQSYCFLMNYHNSKLPQAKLDDIERFFLKLRQTKVKALLRFAYELSPTYYGPTSKRILAHLVQLAPFIRRYADVIYVLQCGFIGKFGEFHNSCHQLESDWAFQKELFAAVLEVLPLERRTMVRYPMIKIKAFGSEPLQANDAFSALPQARIGHFNDGFMAGTGHGGTFMERPDSSEWKTMMNYLDAETTFLPVDGELFWRDLNGTALPTEAVLLFARWHYDTFGFVHGNALFEGTSCYSIDIWKNVPVDPLFLRKNNLPISDGYFEDGKGKFVCRSYYEYIRDHMGYRIELQHADVSVRGKQVEAKLELINRGFSAPVNPRPVQLTLSENGKTLRFPFDTDIRRWYAGEIQRLTLIAELPEAPRAGQLEAGFALPDGFSALSDDPAYAIRCANDLDFREGINIIGLVKMIP